MNMEADRATSHHKSATSRNNNLVNCYNKRGQLRRADLARSDPKCRLTISSLYTTITHYHYISLSLQVLHDIIIRDHMSPYLLLLDIYELYT